ncbi:trafficking protein particle complex subunit 4-like protein Trs23 isoform X2 [Oratosquilla oratoria]|uniref:trafficking protein particle complex subunit 4-like protein Trs23 isoform X2 n=1 Tax=Oratosquilla oratoria TaxID=337810 RepID=UPI003F761513
MRIMTINSVYILSKSGGLIYQLDHNMPVIECEKTFSYPLELKLEAQNKNYTVVYGQRDGIKVGHILMAVNGIKVTGTQLDDGRDSREVLADQNNYPISLKFGRPKLTTNEKIFQASMFYPLYALACQLSPEQRSSGIEVLESDSFKLHCLQTLTGVKFIVMCNPKQTGMEALLRRIYEIYTDYALKNPFYSLEMPVRCEFFDENLKQALELAERSGISNI